MFGNRRGWTAVTLIVRYSGFSITSMSHFSMCSETLVLSERSILPIQWYPQLHFYYIPSGMWRDHLKHSDFLNLNWFSAFNEDELSALYTFSMVYLIFSLYIMLKLSPFKRESYMKQFLGDGSEFLPSHHNPLGVSEYIFWGNRSLGA